MTINQFRSILYMVAKYLGDLQAVVKSVKTGNPQPILKRVARREAGRLTGKALGKIFK